VVYTKQGANHKDMVNRVLEILIQHCLWLKTKKCKFSKAEVKYLGLLISCNCIWMDPAKVKAVANWPASRTMTKLQRFIGFSNFYRHFINQFSKVAYLPHDLTHANTP
jgi:hypothetical protein